MSSIFLIVATFLASSVEMVEALTIVLAIGVTRGWRSSLVGVVAALVGLAITVAILGPALTLVPIGALRVVVGTILLIFGLQWLRKAVLRASGFKAMHDEAAIFQRELNEAKSVSGAVEAGLDWYSFTVCFKGVFLEGLEVVFIVLTFGSNQGNIPLAAVGAAAAVILVGLAGVAVRQPLSQVPENTMKFAVGLLLTTFGMFWGGEGVGVAWPGADAAILGLLAFLFVCSMALVFTLKSRREQSLVAARS
ncbi:MAG: COG4280 domain-containing protein [Chloroflexota bacterium]